MVLKVGRNDLNIPFLMEITKIIIGITPVIIPDIVKRIISFVI